MNVFTKNKSSKKIYFYEDSNKVLGSKTVTTKLRSKSPQNTSMSVFPRQIVLGQKNVVTYVLEIKPCSNPVWIKHKLSQGNRNISKPATNRFKCDDRNTDKPSSVSTQLPHMHTARSMRSDQARAKLGRYIAPERPSH